MPGFVINSGGPGMTNPADKKDWLRNHRFTLLDFFGQLPPTTQKEFLMLKDVTLPDKTITELAIKTPGTTYKFASQANFTDLKLTFYGSTTLLTKCLQLADQVHSLSEGIKDYYSYKGQISFIINDTGGPIEPTIGSVIDDKFGTSLANARQTGIKYEYSGAWISEVNHGQLTYTSSDIKLITVNVKFDFFEVTNGLIQGGTDIVKNSDADPKSILVVPYNGKSTR